MTSELDTVETVDARLRSLVARRQAARRTGDWRAAAELTESIRALLDRRLEVSTGTGGQPGFTR